MSEKTDSFIKAIELIKAKQKESNHDFNISEMLADDKQTEYMADANNWLLVHATAYEPKDNSVETTGHATNYAVPRSTIHFTLNHIVTPNSGGNWNTRPYVVLAPYIDTINVNNLTPVEVSWHDTFFVPSAEKNLQLPSSARIVRPGNLPEGQLIQIKDNETIYKADGYTDEEVKQILALMPDIDRKQYEYWLTGGQVHQEIFGYSPEQLAQNIISEDYTGRLGKIYEKTKDKHAFLVGLLEESRQELLIQFVRDRAVHMTMDNMGYKRTNSNVADMVTDVALANGVKNVSSGTTGHSNSFYGRIEDVWQKLENITSAFVNYGDNPTELVEELDWYMRSGCPELGRCVLNNLIYGRPVPTNIVYNEFVSEFENFKYIGTTDAKTITEFDKNLDDVIRKHCDWRVKHFQEVLQQVRKRPNFKAIEEQIKNTYSDVIDSEAILQNLNTMER